MIIRKYRLQRGWSQDQLAEIAGLSVRTVQRIERGQTPGLESLKSLAAAFDISLDELKPETEMSNPTIDSTEEQRAIEYVRDIKAFYSHAITYVVVIAALFILNLTTSPSTIWAFWPAFGWGIGLLVHGISTFEVFAWFGPEWEQKQINKRLNRR